MGSFSSMLDVPEEGAKAFTKFLETERGKFFWWEKKIFCGGSNGGQSFPLMQ